MTIIGHHNIAIGDLILCMGHTALHDRSVTRESDLHYVACQLSSYQTIGEEVSPEGSQNSYIKESYCPGNSFFVFMMASD